MLKKLQLETTYPFQGLPELVAFDEGLFKAEGLDIEWTPRQEATYIVKADRNVTDWNEVSAFASHGSAAEGGHACLYNACEWGNYRRVDDSNNSSRQIGRRAIMTYGAIAVPPHSEIYTLQQLANIPVGVPYHAGTHYLAILLLEGFLPREAIKTCLAPNGGRRRFEALMSGELEATTLTEPYVTVAERAGCRIVASAFYHGTEVATPEVDGLTYLAFNRAVREAVVRINADKLKYLQYFIDYHKSDPLVAELTVNDLQPGRLQVANPSPIPEDELRRTYEWMKSWDMLQDVTLEELVDVEAQRLAHATL
ncbi:MAG: NitT/TauT family transport system substrate-binding protein [Chloroflexi bacterium]|jgi:NitT/TauT family transport system substrate-binding protein|nr:MAG: NitT/TauT family transport system substrate-binding protein [Chloroflexota bacterium]